MEYTLDQLFAANCAPALAGIVPANLLSLRKVNFPNLDQEIQGYHQAFAPYGVEFTTLCSCQNHELILVYRPKLVAQALGQMGVREVLESYGYRMDQPLKKQLERLGQRVKHGVQFPHEIGVFLGYPVEDVVGFIRNHGQNFKLCGPWKVYGDVVQAQRRFAQIRRVSQRVWERMEQGSSLVQVFSVAS